MASSSPDAGPTSSAGDGGRKRKRGARRRPAVAAPPPPSQWRTDNEHRSYSSKLVEALRRVRPTTPATPLRTRAVREAADRALATAARGRTRWSRAILSGQALRMKARWRRAVAVPHRRRPALTRVQGKEKTIPAVERKGRVLGRLVPGCRKLPFPKLLEETTDYIAALEMQVRAMTALAEILSASSIAAPPLATATRGTPDPFFS